MAEQDHSLSNHDIEPSIAPYVNPDEGAGLDVADVSPQTPDLTSSDPANAAQYQTQPKLPGIRTRRVSMPTGLSLSSGSPALAESAERSTTRALHADDRVVRTPNGERVITARPSAKGDEDEIIPPETKTKGVFPLPRAHVGTRWHGLIADRLEHPETIASNDQPPLHETDGYLWHIANKLGYRSIARHLGEEMTRATDQIAEQTHEHYPGAAWQSEVLITVNPGDVKTVEQITDEEAHTMFEAVNRPEEPIFTVPEDDEIARRVLWENGLPSQGRNVSALTLYQAMQSVDKEVWQASPMLAETGRKVAAVLSYRDASRHLRDATTADGRSLMDDPRLYGYLQGWIMNTSTRADAIGFMRPEGVSEDAFQQQMTQFRELTKGNLWGRRAMASASSYSPEDETATYEFVEQILSGEPMRAVIAEHKTTFGPHTFRPFPERLQDGDILTPDQLKLAHDASHTLMRVVDWMLLDVAPRFALDSNTLRHDPAIRNLQSNSLADRQKGFVALYKRLHGSLIQPSEFLFTRGGGVQLFEPQNEETNRKPLYGFRPDFILDEKNGIETDVTRVDPRIIIRLCNEYYPLMLKRRLDAYVRRLDKERNKR